MIDYVCDNGIMYLKGGVSDGTNTYKAVLIGEQTWMVENLKYNGETFTWAEAMNISTDYNSSLWNNDENNQGICPDNWHLPSNEDLSVLMAAWTTVFAEEFTGEINYGSWWSATENDNYNTYYWFVSSGSLNYSSYGYKADSYAVRCVRD
jgi:hypothetical protein